MDKNLKFTVGSMPKMVNLSRKKEQRTEAVGSSGLANDMWRGVCCLSRKAILK